MEQQVVYTWPGTEPPEKLRLTLVTCNVIEYATYNRLRREVATWWTVRTGQAVQAMDLEASTDEDQALLDVALHRAYMLAALRTVEVSAEVAWRVTALPGDWLPIEGFAYHVPAELYEAWANAARACNPGLFWVDQTPEGKAPAVSNVTTLTMSSPRWS